jgi:single-strand DNA-binding protein
MGSVNKVILVGNLGADPDLKYTASGKAVCNLSVATNETWKDKQGEKQQKVEWHRVNVWGDQAENCSKYLAKGRMVYLEGKLQTRSWEDKEGRKRYVTEVVADRVVFLGGEGGTARGSQQEGSGAGKHREERWPPKGQPPDQDPNNGYETSGAGGPSDDDIPF